MIVNPKTITEGLHVRETAKCLFLSEHEESPAEFYAKYSDDISVYLELARRIAGSAFRVLVKTDPVLMDRGSYEIVDAVCRVAERADEAVANVYSSAAYGLAYDSMMTDARTGRHEEFDHLVTIYQAFNQLKTEREG